MSGSLQNLSLDRIYSVNHLGVLLDPKLIYDTQITYTVNKAECSWVYKVWSPQYQHEHFRVRSNIFLSAVISKCMQCFRLKPKLVEHIISPLLDFCGPFPFVSSLRLRTWK